MNSLTAVVSQLISCDTGEAFDAFVDPEKITQFWLSSASAPLTQGEKATWGFMVPDVVDTVTVDVLEPKKFIAITWSDGAKLRLRFEEYSPRQTRVFAEFTFSSADTIQQVVNTTEGYAIVLCDLKTFLESGHSANLVRAKAQLIADQLRRE